MKASTKDRSLHKIGQAVGEGYKALYSVEQLASLDTQMDFARHPQGIWRKLTVELHDQRDLIISMPLARALDTWVAQKCQAIYFARYTSPTPRIEYQLCRANVSPRLDRELRNYVLSICKKAGLRNTTTRLDPCEGSVLHGFAFRIACMMEDKDVNSLKMVGDVTHWLSNMLGYSYAQEAEHLLRSAHLCLTNTVGYFEKPMFQNPFVMYRQAVQARRELAEMEASKAQAKSNGKRPGKSNGV